MNNLYLTESMRKYCTHTLDEYWDKKDTPYSDGCDFWPYWLCKYFNKLRLGGAIESAYLIWKSEQHRLTPKYDIMRSLFPLVKNYFVTMEEDDTLFKITCQHCNGYVTCKIMSVELLCTTFIHAGLSTILMYPEELDPENFYFQRPDNALLARIIR